MYVKGAPESLLPRASMILTAQGEQDHERRGPRGRQKQAAAHGP